MATVGGNNTVYPSGSTSTGALRVNGYGNPYGGGGMQSTNTKISRERLACAQFWSFMLIMFGPMLLLPGISLTAINASFSVEDSGWSGGLIAGVVLLSIGVLGTTVGIVICCCVIRPPCCGFKYPEGEEPQIQQAPTVFIAGYTGQQNYMGPQPPAYHAQPPSYYPSGQQQGCAPPQGYVPPPSAYTNPQMPMPGGSQGYGGYDPTAPSMPPPEYKAATGTNSGYPPQHQ